jgi:hypothetical protein
MQIDLQTLLDQHGEDLLFLVPLHPLRSVFGIMSYTSSNDGELLAPARITQERYEIKDRYKVTLKPIYPGLETRHFYISDLESLIRDDQVQVFISVVKQVESA